jgi:hypothetical protein
MKPIHLIGICILLCLVPPVIAGTIYTWTDSEGKKHFSDQPPPQTVTEFKKMEAAPGATGQTDDSSARRQSYDRMIEEARKESRRSEELRRRVEKAREIEEKRKAEEKRRAAIEPERQRIEKEIQDIENRALSPTLTKGMKEAQIEKLRKELEALKASAK